jgi:hypothetical protein
MIVSKYKIYDAVEMEYTYKGFQCENIVIYVLIHMTYKKIGNLLRPLCQSCAVNVKQYLLDLIILVGRSNFLITRL